MVQLTNFTHPSHPFIDDQNRETVEERENDPLIIVIQVGFSAQQTITVKYDAVLLLMS
jgi:hypothetical protein